MNTTNENQIKFEFYNCENCLWRDNCKKENLPPIKELEIQSIEEEGNEVKVNNEFKETVLEPCEYFSPVSESEFCTAGQEEINLHIKATCERKKRGKCFTRKMFKNRHLSYKEENWFDTTLDDYYVGMINDALSDIRSGQVTYLFHTYEVEDILSCEPDCEYELKDGVYYIWKLV
jgi:hypothetical protein